MKILNQTTTDMTVRFSAADADVFCYVVHQSITGFWSRYRKYPLWPAGLNDDHGDELLKQLPDTSAVEFQDGRDVDITLSHRAWTTSYQVLLMSIYGAFLSDGNFYGAYGLQRDEVRQRLDKLYEVYRKFRFTQSAKNRQNRQSLDRQSKDRP